MPLVRSLGWGSGHHASGKYPLDREIGEIGFHQNVDEFTARRAKTWIGGLGEQDHDRVGAGGRDMRGTGVVPHNQGGGTYESSEPSDIGMADEVHRLGA